MGTCLNRKTIVEKDSKKLESYIKEKLQNWKPPERESTNNDNSILEYENQLDEVDRIEEHRQTQNYFKNSQLITISEEDLLKNQKISELSKNSLALNINSRHVTLNELKDKEMGGASKNSSSIEGQKIVRNMSKGMIEEQHPPLLGLDSQNESLDSSFDQSDNKNYQKPKKIGKENQNSVTFSKEQNQSKKLMASQSIYSPLSISSKSSRNKRMSKVKSSLFIGSMTAAVKDGIFFNGEEEEGDKKAINEDYAPKDFFQIFC